MLHLGFDVGGTKVAAGLVDVSQLVFKKLKLVSGFQGRVFKGKEKERVICNWLMYILLVG